MNTDANTWRFPAICPHCSADAGRPARILESTGTKITIAISCDRCAKEWDLSADAPPLFLRPKPDRRIAKQ